MMLKRSMNEHDALEDFDPRKITLDGLTKTVHVAGSGPAVIVMTEMPGISPQVARFSRWVRDAGFTVYMPSLFGRDGAVPDVEEGTAIFERACVSADRRGRQPLRCRPRALRHRGEPLHFDELAGPLATGPDKASPAADGQALDLDAVTAAHIRRVSGMTGGKIHGPGAQASCWASTRTRSGTG